MELFITLVLITIFISIVFMTIKNDYKFEFDNLKKGINQKGDIRALVKKEERAFAKFRKLKSENNAFYNEFVTTSKIFLMTATKDQMELIKLSKQIEIYRYQIYNLCDFVSNSSNENFADYISGVIDYKVDLTTRPSLILIQN